MLQRPLVKARPERDIKDMRALLRAGKTDIDGARQAYIFVEAMTTILANHDEYGGATFQGYRSQCPKISAPAQSWCAPALSSSDLLHLRPSLLRSITLVGARRV